MKCPKCEIETDLKFCPNCHGLIREPFVEKDEKEELLKNGIGAYLKDYNHSIVTKNFTFASLIFGPFYTSYYKLCKITFLEIILDVSLVLYILSGYVPIILIPFTTLWYWFLICFRYFSRATLGNALMLIEIKSKIKKMIAKGDDLEIISIKGGTSIVLPAFVLATYVLIFMLFIKF